MKKQSVLRKRFKISTCLRSDQLSSENIGFDGIAISCGLTILYANFTTTSERIGAH